MLQVGYSSEVSLPLSELAMLALQRGLTVSIASHETEVEKEFLHKKKKLKIQPAISTSDILHGYLVSRLRRQTGIQPI